MRMKMVVLFAAIVATVAVFAVGPDLRAAPEPIVDVEIDVSPSVVYMASKGVWVTVHAEISFSSVQALSVRLDDVPVEFTKSDNRGQLVAKFTLDSVKKILTPGTMELTLRGTTFDGVDFEGTDSIRVIASRK